MEGSGWENKFVASLGRLIKGEDSRTPAIFRAIIARGVRESIAGDIRLIKFCPSNNVPRS